MNYTDEQIAELMAKYAAMFEILKSINQLEAKEDPEAWREEYRKKQSAGVEFEHLAGDWKWYESKLNFTGRKEDYRYRVKPKTVKYYFALGERGGAPIARSDDSKERLIERFEKSHLTIIGNIEEREVPIE